VGDFWGPDAMGESTCTTVGQCLTPSPTWSFGRQRDSIFWLVLGSRRFQWDGACDLVVGARLLPNGSQSGKVSLYLSLSSTAPSISSIEDVRMIRGLHHHTVGFQRARAIHVEQLRHLHTRSRGATSRGTRNSWYVSVGTQPAAGYRKYFLEFRRPSVRRTSSLNNDLQGPCPRATQEPSWKSGALVGTARTTSLQRSGGARSNPVRRRRRPRPVEQERR